MVGDRDRDGVVELGNASQDRHLKADITRKEIGSEKPLPAKDFNLSTYLSRVGASGVHQIEVSNDTIQVLAMMAMAIASNA